MKMGNIYRLVNALKQWLKVNAFIIIAPCLRINKKGTFIKVILVNKMGFEP